MASYYDQLKTLAESIGSDGCSHATQWYQQCCWEHDWAYVTGTTPRGVPVTKEQADQRFRDCIQAHSSFRWFSPMSWWRFLAVKKFGKGVWNKVNRTETKTLLTHWNVSREQNTIRLLAAQGARARIKAELGLA